MPLPRWLKVCWQGTHLCGRGTLACAVWSTWIVLGALLAIQVFILTTRELAVPRFVLREIETRLEAAGLRVAFGGAVFDPGGHVLLSDARLTLAGIDEPVLRAQSIYIELNPISLWLRQVEPQIVRVSGADLLIPGILSPSGTSEPLVERLDFSIRPGKTPRLLHLDHLTARVGPVPVDLSGAFQLPPSGAETPPLEQLLAKLSTHYLQISRLAARHLPRLPSMEAPRLRLELEPSDSAIAQVKLSAQVGALELPAPPGGSGMVQLENLSAHARFNLGSVPRLTTIDLHADTIHLPHGVSLTSLRAQLEAMVSVPRARFEPRLLDLSSPRLSHPVVDLTDLSVRAGVATLPQVQAVIHASLLDQPLAITADLDVTTRAGRVQVETALDRALLPIVGRQVKFDVPSLVDWQESPHIRADINLGPGGKPLRARAQLSTQAVTAYRVPLDETAARITWQGTELVAEDILLRCNDSLATGRYEMDFKTLDFRFLLGGRLEPADINGWFRDWWPNFWSNFQFNAAPPDARVEVSGTWKQPLVTRIWIQAEGRDAVVKGIELDAMRTRLFVRPGWSDILEFHAWRPQGEVRGSFAREWRLPNGARWTRIEVKASGESDLSPLPKLLGDLGERIIAPFAIAEPVRLNLEGRVVREDLGAPVSMNFAVDGQSSGEWSFFNFPLRGVDFRARQDDERLLIAPFSAGMTGGALSGRVELRGPSEAQNVAFDLNLDHAHLGETIRAVETWTANRAGTELGAETDFQQQIAEGMLNVSLTAEGPAADPYAYVGQGAASIENANLGELKLLGVLSTLLDRTLLNFSTMQLDNASGDFALDGRVLRFDNLKVTGPRGAIDAEGSYYLDTTNLGFFTRIRPFEGRGRNLLDVVFTPLTHALEVKLGGQLKSPEWTFVLGPTNILRSLTGTGPRADAVALPAVLEGADSAPSPIRKTDSPAVPSSRKREPEPAPDPGPGDP